MLKTYLYVPDHLEAEIRRTAESQKKSKAQIMRQALEKGIPLVKRQAVASAQALLKLAEVGKQRQLRGPRDSSTRMDELLWTKQWSQSE